MPNLKSESHMPSIKPEIGTSASHVVQRPRPFPGVVDLTADDSDDDEEIAEIAPNNFTPSRRAPRPAMADPYRLPQMPGAYPTPTAYNNPQAAHQLNVADQRVRDQYGLMRDAQRATMNAIGGVKYAASSVSGQLRELNGLIDGSSSGPYTVDDDEDLVYGGARQRPLGDDPLDPYAGQDELYRHRFDTLAAYDPAKSKEEINALLENIRPDEDMPAHLRVQTPEAMTIKLHKYQELGLTWLQKCEEGSNKGGILADDMGLGKTIQFIAFLLHLKEQEALKHPTLLVCPTSVLGNWEREVKKFGPTLKVLLYHGDKRPKAKAFTSAIKGQDLVLTSYALIHRDLKELQSVSWQGVVLDEAQNIKNSESKQSQSVRQLQSSFRIALTGTPVENRLQELWSILDFLNPGYLGARQFFQRRFAIPIEKFGDAASLQTLRSLVQPFILRRLKSDREIIQDLPEKQEMTVFCSLSTQQAALYQQVVEESLAEIDLAQGLQRRGMILGLLVKLKQVCNHPAQFLKESTLGQYHSGKLQRLEEMLESALTYGDRALIFTQFAEWGKLLKPYLEQQLRRETLFLYGSTSKKQREEMIDRFQHDPQGPPVMILSLKAGGVGLNLTRANHVFHFDRWWNPAVENQATDRVFRIGQTRNVQVHKFVCTGTLEEKIHEMIESKKALAEQVVGAGEQWLTELDTDQLRNLLMLDRDAVMEDTE